MVNLIIATGNEHKIAEIRSILGGEFQVSSLSGIPNLPAIVEDAPDYRGNALKKAIAIAMWLGEDPSRFLHFQFGEGKVFVLADDSGLEVDALNGAPGVKSARFASAPKEGNAPATDNNQKLLSLLGDIPAEKRGARFRCSVAIVPLRFAEEAQGASPVCYADEMEIQAQMFDGLCTGSIVESPRGNQGFGYDPLFIPEGYEKTFGELPEGIKNEISHRAMALAQVKCAIQGQHI